MNILKAIYRDSSTGTDVLRFAEDGLILSIDGFTSKSWSIRNAAQLLLGTGMRHFCFLIQYGSAIALSSVGLFDVIYTLCHQVLFNCLYIIC